MIAQYLVVGLIVLLAALYAAGKYLPLSWRRRIVYKFSDGSGKGLLARWLDKDAGCGSGCDTCGTCAPEPMPEKDEKGRKIIQVHVKRSRAAWARGAHPTKTPAATITEL